MGCRCRETGDQLSGVSVQFVGDPEDVDEADVALSALGRADVRPVQPNVVR